VPDVKWDDIDHQPPYSNSKVTTRGNWYNPDVERGLVVTDGINDKALGFFYLNQADLHFNNPAGDRWTFINNATDYDETGDIRYAVVDGPLRTSTFNGNTFEFVELRSHANKITTGPLTDVVYGSVGDDTIFGGAGADTLYGGTDLDVIYGEGGNDILFGDQDNLPTLNSSSEWSINLSGDSSSSPFADTLDGGAGNDILYGASGADYLRGGTGGDTLFGGFGHDLLYGGPRGENNTDHLYGGDGSDVFYLANSLPVTTANAGAVTDFWGQQEVLWSVGIGQNLATEGFKALTKVALNTAFDSLPGGMLLSGLGNIVGLAAQTGIRALLQETTALPTVPRGTQDVVVVTDFDPRIDKIVLPLADPSATNTDGSNNAAQTSITKVAKSFSSSTVNNLKGWGIAVESNNKTIAEIFFDPDYLAEFGLDATSTGAEGLLENVFKSALVFDKNGFADGKNPYPFQNLAASAFDGTLPAGLTLDPASNPQFKSPEGTKTEIWGAFGSSVIISPSLETGTLYAGGTRFGDVLFATTGSYAPARWDNDSTAQTSVSSYMKGFDGNDYIFGSNGQDSLFGGSGDDSLFGWMQSGADDQLHGEAGNDWLYAAKKNVSDVDARADFYGGGGTDTASFEHSRVPVIIDLSGATGSFNADVRQSVAPNYTFNSIENIVGTDVAVTKAFADDALRNDFGLREGDGDWLTGDAGANFLSGLGGNDTLIGLGGNDTLDGGTGSDLVTYITATGAVTVDLRNGSVSGAAGQDVLKSIERVRTTEFDDLVYVATSTDTVDGGAGNDHVSYQRVSQKITLDGTTPSNLMSIEELTGTGLDDNITAHSGLKIIRAGAGNDTLKGAGEAILLEGDAGEDRLLQANSNDTLSGGAGNDVLVVQETFLEGGPQSSFATFDGGAGIDSVSFELLTAGAALNPFRIGEYAFLSSIEGVVGTEHADTLELAFSVQDAGGGNDTVRSVVTEDATLRGGAGLDLLEIVLSDNLEIDAATGVASSTAVSGPRYAFSGFESLRGGFGNDTFTGSSGDDYFDGYHGNDSMSGGDGNDVLIGSLGDDTLNGGAGDDSLHGDFIGTDALPGTDVVSYAGATGAVQADLASGTATGAAGNDVIVGFEKLLGSSHGDILLGSDRAEALSGDAGDDTLTGRDGDDTLDGGAGSDLADYSAVSGAVEVDLSTGTASGPGGTDTLIDIEGVTGSGFADTLTGNDSAGSSNTLSGGAGADRITGRAAADLIDGGDDADTISAGAGNDTLIASRGRDIIDAGSGEDWIIFTEAANGIRLDFTQPLNVQNNGFGQAGVVNGVEHLIGSAFDDVIQGAPALSVLGGAGSDTLIGGLSEQETLDGGAGDDVLGYLAVTNTTDLSGFSKHTTFIGGVGTDTVDYAALQVDGTVRLLEVDLTSGMHLLSTVTGFGLPGYPVIENPNQHIATSTGIENVIGFGDGANDLAGNDGANLIVGGFEDDKLSGRAGDDTLTGGRGKDTIDGGAGYDIVQFRDNGSTGVFVDLAFGEFTQGLIQDAFGTVDVVNRASIEAYSGTSANDFMLGDGGNGLGALFGADLIGNAGNDTLIGNGLGQTLDGGVGNDFLRGLSGDDTILGGDDFDVVFGDAGNDSIDGGTGGDGIDAGAGSDIVRGGAGSDVIDYRFAQHGSGDDDTVFGGADQDSLHVYLDDASAGSATTAAFDTDVSDASFMIGTVSNSTKTTTLRFSEAETIYFYSDPDGSTITVEGAPFQSGVLRNTIYINGAERGVDVVDASGIEDGVRVVVDAKGGADTVIGGSGADILYVSDGGTASGGLGDDTYISRGGTIDDFEDGDRVTFAIDGGATLRSVENGQATFVQADGEVTTLSGAFSSSEASRFMEATSEDGYTITLTEETAASRVVDLGTTSDDLIYGSHEGDLITGGTGDDTLDGNGADDVLRGGDGDDFLRGEADNDRLFGDDGDDTLMGGTGDDTASGGDGDDDLRGGNGSDTLIGGAGDDTADGGRGSDQLFGGAGADLLKGGGDDGADTVLGEAGDDRIEGGGGNDTLDGGSGRDSIDGGSGGDVISGGSDSDRIHAGTGKDTVAGGDGDDLVVAGAGDDEVMGGSGSDLITGDAGHDRLSGGSGNDGINGDDGDDEIFGDDGDDALFGDAGRDTIDGGTGSDIVDGGAGQDALVGGTGIDTVFGGDDADIFWITAGEGHDIIADFEPGQDLIGLSEGLSLDVLRYDGETIHSGDDLLAQVIGLDTASLSATDFVYEVAATEPVGIQHTLFDFNAVQVSSFSMAQDKGTMSVSEDGTGLTLKNNAWKAIDIRDVDLTPDTILGFEFYVDQTPEIAGIGFDGDGKQDASEIFRILGSQDWGMDAYDGIYDAGDEAKRLDIRLGDHFSAEDLGSFDRLVFVNDDDVAPSSAVTFANVEFI